jgi:VWFA-related protein
MIGSARQVRIVAMAIVAAISFAASDFSRMTASSQAQSQTPQQQQQQPPQPTFRTEANYVRVDVYPTRDGAPVTDLTQQDFEVLENGAPQKIEQFERVQIRAAGPQETRVEPNTVAESRSMAQNPRARLFVVFLDTYHVDVAASHNIRKPLIDALDHVIAPDDLVAVMTPEMAATDLTFARKTTTIEGFLTKYWYWGERDRGTPPDPVDEQYGYCYANQTPTPQHDCTDQNGIAAEMIDRRHEKLALDSLQDLVRYLRGVREERKAILAITNGWLLFRPDDRLARKLNCHALPSGGNVGVDPRSGKLTTKDPPGSPSYSRCDIDRMNLSRIDDDREFRDILDEANAANASFYPIDPRGLAVFDTPIMRTDVPGPPPPMAPLAVDNAMLRGRITSLRMLAEATDGLAIVNSNDLAGGVKRVVADLSSYYLLGYYSNGKLDGKFHSITVRVKRPGVQIRARRGYLAATPGAVTAAARRAAGPPSVDAKADAEGAAISTALAALSGVARDVPLRVDAIAGWRGGSAGQRAAGFWVIGESTGPPQSNGAVDITIIDASGTTVARASAPGTGRSVLIPLTPAAPIEPGDYTVRVRAEGASATTVTAKLPPAPDAGGAVFIRRGQTTGNKDTPTADHRFRRSETIRVEIPGATAASPAARLLDRTGKALAIPVTAASRDDADGTHWQTAQVALAPLAVGDYLIEMGSDTSRTLVAFRVVP